MPDPIRPTAKPVKLTYNSASVLLPKMIVAARKRRGHHAPRVQPKGDCWVWLGAQRKGMPVWAPSYGVSYQVRRVVYAACRGPLGQGWVKTICSTANCVAPMHLLHRQRMSESEMDDIRRRWLLGERQVDIGRQFGLEQTQVSRVVRGEIAFCIPIPPQSEPIRPKSCEECPCWMILHRYGDSEEHCSHPDSPDDFAPEPGKCGLFVRPIQAPKVIHEN